MKKILLIILTSLLVFSGVYQTLARSIEPFLVITGPIYSTTAPTTGVVTVSFTCTIGGGWPGNCATFNSGWSKSGVTFSKTFSSNTSGTIVFDDDQFYGIPNGSRNYSIANIGSAFVNGVCNNAVRNTCLSGTANDPIISDTFSYYRWRCDGSNGGTNSSTCQISKGGTCIQYNTMLFKECKNGYLRDWILGGENCGDILGMGWGPTGVTEMRESPLAGCAVYAYDGVCDNSTRNACTSGTPNDGAISDTPTYYKWRCDGINGGANSATCLIIKPDTTAPTGAVSYSTTAWTKNNVTVTVTCSDGGSGCVQSTYTKTVSANSSGIIPIADNAGNTRNISYSVGNIDKTMPSTAVIQNISTGWVSSDTVTIGCSDGGSGCKSGTYQYRTSNSNFACNSTGTWNTGVSYTATTKKYICARVKDIVLNSYKYSSTAYINKVIPQCATDLYWNGSSCIAVGVGFYSANGSNSKIACTGLPTNSVWSTDGNGTDNCNFSCNTNYTKSGASCIADTRTVSCLGSIVSNATRTTGTTYTQTWNGSSWGATDSWNENGGATCDFACDVNYSWNGTSCVAGGRTVTCSGSIPTQGYATTGTTYAQTWNGSIWTPTDTWNITGGSSCDYNCNSGYSGSSCLDTTNPTAGTASYLPTGWTNGNVDVSVLCTDSESGCVQPTYIKNVSANGGGTIYVYDIAGNSTGRGYNVTKIDKSDPTATVVYSTTAWTKNSVTVSIICSDQVGLSGCDMTYNNAGWGKSGNTYTNSFSTNTSGSINIKDIAGNLKNISYNITNIDGNRPTVNATNYSNSIWRNSLVGITLTRNDSGGSNISYSKYIWDGSDATCRSSGTSYVNNQVIDMSSISGNDQGSHTLYLCARDTAGNNSLAWNNIYLYDIEKPIVGDNYSFDNIWKNTGFTITLSSSDINPSGANTISNIKETRYCWGGGCSLTTNIDGTLGISIPVPPDINNTLRYRTWDFAGNGSTIGSIDVKIEDNVPTTTMSFTKKGTPTTTYVNNSWVKFDITATLNCDFTSNGIINSICDTSTYEYRTGITPIADCSIGGLWNSYTSPVDIITPADSNKVSYICSRVKDIAGNGYSYSPVYTIKIDKWAPKTSDISDTTIPKDSKLLAGNHSFSTTVGVNAGSPIIKIEGRFEDEDNPSLYTPVQLTNSDTLPVTANMTQVDNDRTIGGYRQYSFKVTKIEDEAGNITQVTGLELTDPEANATDLPKYLYSVFADAQNLGVKQVITNELDDVNIADGISNKLTVRLQDIYSNDIIPASDITRTIDVKFDVTNNLKLDQYKTSASTSAVYFDKPNNVGTFGNTLPSGINTFSNQWAKDGGGNYIGDYNYNFRVYTPTFLSGATDGRELANGDMTIHKIDYDIKQNISSYIGISYTGGIDLITPKIEFAFKPLYIAKFSGDLANSAIGILVDQIQDSSITVTKTSGSSVSILNDSIRLGFGQTNGANNNVSHPNLNLVYDPINNTTGITEGHQTNITTLKDLGNIGNKNFSVKVKQQSGPIDTSLATYVSTHLKYNIGGIGPIIYDSGVIGKTRYVDGTNLINTNQIGLKVFGKVQSKTQVDLTNGQTGTDLYQLGNNPKSGLKELIRKQVALVTKNIPNPQTSGLIDDILGVKWNNSNGTKVKNDTILYYDLDPGTNLVIGAGSELVAQGVKTLVVTGGNIYIKNNIKYGNRSTDILGIIALEDNAGLGGNIYIDPSVTDLVGTYYADKSMISYDGTNEIDGSVGTNILKNQLYLYGTLFTENTIGGSLIPKCPYYITGTCDINIARKYDLNYLRRYFLQSGTPYVGGQKSQYSPSDIYPIVIEYNPSIQITPPPLFDN